MTWFTVFVVTLAVFVLGYAAWPYIEETRLYYRLWVAVWRRRKVKKW